MIRERTRDSFLDDTERALLIQRPWTPDERQAVMRGVYGRATIAVEPVIVGGVFLALVIGLLLRGDWLLAPIFLVGVVGAVGWFMAVVRKPILAMREMKKPIFIVDGYMRLREPDEESDEGAGGYIAVLTHDRRVACEWPLSDDADEVRYGVRPTLIEFSVFGGVHSVDGKTTGVVPNHAPALGVGLALALDKP
jgi:hypothetical protein